MNAREYIERYLKIQDKTGRLIPLILNPLQLLDPNEKTQPQQ